MSHGFPPPREDVFALPSNPQDGAQPGDRGDVVEIGEAGGRDRGQRSRGCDAIEWRAGFGPEPIEMTSQICPNCGGVIAVTSRLRLLVLDAMPCRKCGVRLVVRRAWSRLWHPIGLLLVFVPGLLRTRYFPDVPSSFLVLWIAAIWLAVSSVTAMGRLEIEAVRKPFPPLEVFKFGALLFLIVAMLLAGLAALSWIVA